MRFRKQLSDFPKAEFLRKLHVAACAFGGLLCMYWLLRCYAGFSSAWDDFEKFRDLGFSYTYQYHLQREQVYRDVIVFACAGIEWLLYFLQYRRVEQKKKITGTAWILFLFLAVHIAMWLYAKTLPYPDGPPFEEAVLAAAYFRLVANRRMLPSAVYCVSCLLCVRNMKE